MFETPHAEKTATTFALLSAHQKESYQHNGFLVLENFVQPMLCDMLMERARFLIETADLSGFKTIFSTLEKHHERNQYFLESGDKIRFFFEENAIDANGDLKVEKLFCINKIGHALHDLDPIFYAFSRAHKLAQLTKELNLSDPLLVQSMYICKQPYIGGEVTCHQDSTYLFVKGDQPVTGFWFALEDATINNGCLWAIPGGHRSPLKSRMLVDKNDRIATEIYDDSHWPLDKMVPLEVKKGSLVVLHGLLPHMSKENVSARSRHAYTLHVVSNRYEFPQDNWIARKRAFPFKGFI